jgi:protein gp37
MTRWNRQRAIRFDSKELTTDLGAGRVIFVGSSNDMFSSNISPDWITETLKFCTRFENKYLFQTKNPANLLNYQDQLPQNSIVCTTIETNRFYTGIMGNSPEPALRAIAMSKIDRFEKHITIEPIMDFDHKELVDLVKLCDPVQVNVGADSGGHNLPEPSKEKILRLLSELEQFVNVFRKKNLSRLLK